jgi:hypothetical protein
LHISGCKQFHLSFASPSPPFESSNINVGIKTHVVKGGSMKINDAVQTLGDVMANKGVVEPVYSM